MPIGSITEYIDVAQLVLYAFWLFFFILVLYLHQEGKREGYPLVPDPAIPAEAGRTNMVGFPGVPTPKTFHLHDGTTRQAPRENDFDDEVKATPMEGWPGAPLVPTGNPMIDAVGPASYAKRPDQPEQTMHGGPRLLPMRVAEEFSVASGDPDPRGMPVVGADGQTGGVVTDIWVDLAEPQVRYLEVKVQGGTAAAGEGAEGEAASSGERTVLLPIGFSRVDGYNKRVKVVSILGSQFADVPTLQNPDQVTQLEEEKISAYYGGGVLYAHQGRQEPLL